MARFLRQPAQLARLARQSQQSRIYRGGFHSASRAARLAAPSVPRTSLSYNLNTHASATSPLSPLSRRPYSTKGPEPPKNDDKQDDAKKDDSQNQNQNEQPKTQEEDPVDSELEKKRKEWPLPEGWIYLNEEELKVIQDFGKLAKLPGWMKDDVTSSVEAIKVVGAPVELRELIEDRRVKSTPPTMMEIGRIMRIMHKMASKLAEYESVMAFKEDKAKSDTQNASEKEESRQEKESSGSEKSSENKRERRKSESGGSGSGGKGGGDGGDSGGGNPFTRKWFLGRFSTGDLVMTAIVWAFVESLIGGSFFKQTKEITWQEAHKNLLSKGLIKKLTVLSSGRVRIELNQDAGSGIDGLDPNVDYYFSIGSVEAFEKKLEEAQSQLGIPPAERIPVNYAQETGMWPIVMAFGPTLLLVGLLMYTTRQMGGGRGGNQMFGFGKSKAKMFNHESAVKVKFADVAGMDEAKAEIMEFVSFLKTPERFEKLGAKIPRGAILSGPPGTGKTLLAKATAGESGVPFFSVSGSEFVEMFVGVGSSRVRDLFASARKNSPCIIFIDEIDAIGRSRMDNNRPGGNDERETTLNQILTEMDGFNTSEQVVVLAGTNRADILDQALTRPGRFDRHIYIDRPTMKGRQDIFKVHLKKIVTKEELEHLVGRLSTLTPGFSGADIANVVNEAALAAARANASSVELVHFEQAIERVIGGLERKSLVLKPEEKRTVAYHEAGHAICGWFLENADPLLKVSIIPRGKGALGYAQYLPAGDAYLMSVPQLMDRMAMTLGGRISEELHFPTVTTGASDDFRKVTQMARKMVTEWGMSERVGPLHYSEEESSRSFQKPFSESTAQEIDGEVRAIVDKAYARCKELLESRRKEIGLVAEDLLKKEMLTRDDLVRLLGKRPFGDNQEFEKYFGGGGPGDGGSGTGGKSAPPPFPTENVDDPPERPPAPAFREVDGRDVRG